MSISTFEARLSQAYLGFSRHAAASYGHLDILEYLISRGKVLQVTWTFGADILIGGDVNVTDEDGDTPLYVVENVQTAQFLVEHGAVVNRQNAEGLSVCLAHRFLS